MLAAAGFVWDEACKAHAMDASRAASLVRAASVLDVTAEAVVEVLESAAADGEAGLKQVEPGQALTLRDLEISVQQGLVQVSAPAYPNGHYLLIHHLQRMGFRQAATHATDAQGATDASTPASQCEEAEEATNLKIPYAAAHGGGALKMVLGVEEVGVLLAADLHATFRHANNTRGKVPPHQCQPPTASSQPPHL